MHMMSVHNLRISKSSQIDMISHKNFGAWLNFESNLLTKGISEYILTAISTKLADTTPARIDIGILINFFSLLNFYKALKKF